MTYAYHGPAQVTVSVRHLGRDPVEALNRHATIGLRSQGPAHLACLEFAGHLHAPDQANYVQVQLPNGHTLGGHVLEEERTRRGSGWLLVHLDTGDWQSLV